MRETLTIKRYDEQFHIELSGYPEALFEVEEFVAAAVRLRDQVHGLVLSHDAGLDISGALKACSLLVSQLEVATEIK